MIKINHCSEGMARSSKRFHSSKHLNYEEQMKLLGKKLFFQKNIEKRSKDNKNLRIKDIVDYQNQLQNKEIDLPIAMKYRLSKTQPRRVDVGPSKIHRNGLFTFEEYDISDYRLV